MENPKRIRSAYNFFSQDFFNKEHIAADHHETIHDAAAEWKKLPEKERRIYEQKNKEDQERYEKEIKIYEKQFLDRGVPVLLTKKGGIFGGGWRERSAELFV